MVAMEFLEAQARKTCLKFVCNSKTIVAEYLFTFMIKLLLAGDQVKANV